MSITGGGAHGGTLSSSLDFQSSGGASAGEFLEQGGATILGTHSAGPRDDAGKSRAPPATRNSGAPRIPMHVSVGITCPNDPPLNCPSAAACAIKRCSAWPPESPMRATCCQNPIVTAPFATHLGSTKEKVEFQAPDHGKAPSLPVC